MTEDLTTGEPKTTVASELDALRLRVAAMERELALQAETARKAETVNSLAAQQTEHAIARAGLLDMAIKLAERVAVLEYRHSTQG